MRNPATAAAAAAETCRKERRERPAGFSSMGMVSPRVGRSLVTKRAAQKLPRSTLRVFANRTHFLAGKYLHHRDDSGGSSHCQEYLEEKEKARRTQAWTYAKVLIFNKLTAPRAECRGCLKLSTKIEFSVEVLLTAAAQRNIVSFAVLASSLYPARIKPTRCEVTHGHRYCRYHRQHTFRKIVRRAMGKTTHPSTRRFTREVPSGMGRRRRAAESQRRHRRHKQIRMSCCCWSWTSFAQARSAHQFHQRTNSRGARCMARP